MNYLISVILVALPTWSKGALLSSSQALEEASSRGNAVAVASALERGADARRLSPEGLTPLMLAARAGSFESVAVLLRSGVPSDFSNESGKTALDFAPVPRDPKMLTDSADLRQFLLQILLRCYICLERNGERASPDQPVTDPSLVMLDSPAVDHSLPALARAIRLNPKEAAGLPETDDDENGFVDDVMGWRAQPLGPWGNTPQLDLIFSRHLEPTLKLLSAHNAAQISGSVGKSTGADLTAGVVNPNSDAPTLPAVLEASRGTCLAGLVLEASGQKARLKFMTLPTSQPASPAGPSCKAYLGELAREIASPDEYCDRFLDHNLIEQIAIGKELSRYLRRTGAGIVLLPPVLTHWMEETLTCADEAFASLSTLKIRLTPQQLQRLRWDLICYEAVPAAMMMYENPNVLFVCAAGDDARDVDGTLTAPAGLSRFFSNCVTVSSVDDRGQLSTFSNQGSLCVQLGALGERAVGPAPAGNSLTLSSTSVAASRVAGVAASLRIEVPRMTAEELAQLLVESADASLPYPGRSGPPRLNPTRAREFLPGNTPAGLLAHASSLRSKGRVQAAANAVRAALDVEKTPEGWIELAEVEHASGNAASAAVTAGKALALQPNNVPLLRRRAGWWRELGDLPSFSADYDAALTLVPDDSELPMEYARALYDWKSYRRSGQLFQDIINKELAKNAPVPALAKAGLALSLWHDEATKGDAISHFRNLLETEPRYNQPAWWPEQGWQSEALETLQSLNAAITQSPQVPSSGSQ